VRAAHAWGLSNTIPDAESIAARRRNARRLIVVAVRELQSVHAAASSFSSIGSMDEAPL
jgi:hypothetical protein